MRPVPGGEYAGDEMLLDLNPSPPEMLDLNFRPEHDKSDLSLDQETIHNQETVHNQEGAISEEEAASNNSKQKRNLPNDHRFGAYFALQVIQNRDGKVQKKDKELIASLLNTNLRTVERIWEDAREQIAEGKGYGEVDVSNRKKGNCGRKRKDLNLERVSTIPLNRMRTMRALSKALGVSCLTLHLRFQCGELKHVTNSLKPLLKPANKIERLKFCINMLDENSITSGSPNFKEMDKIVYIDEKWFNMTSVNNTYYLLPDEPAPERTVQNKNSIGNVMFLTAVAKPRYGEGGVVTFDGKIGTWAFVTETPAVRRSENREKGTLELKSLKVNRNVMREYLCTKVIPAIEDKWPDEDEGRTIYIQQDNATPHVKPTDEAFLQVVAQTDLDTKLIQQPPNSPDMNVLDLCFFRSLQSLTDCRAPKNIRELIEAVEEEFKNYDVDTLARSFLTLQSCLREVMKAEGGIRYDIPHMGKIRKQKERRLPICLSCEAGLVVQTLALIGQQ